MSLDVAQVEAVFAGALRLPAAKRENYLRVHCRLDETVLREVDSLLKASETNCLIDTPIFEESLLLFANHPSKLCAGKVVGHYKILALLGQGGMGEVYLALDLRLDRKVALKFILKDVSSDVTSSAQLREEAKAMAKLDHDNICPIYSIEEVDDELFIVMQYIEGKTLSSLITERKVRFSDMNNMVRQIVSALAYAHSNGVIHRDIKPQNVMVSPTGRIKLLDFGLAITSRPKRGIKTATNQKIFGTPRYMSPEQLRGEFLDSRSDVFNLGVLIFEMISGKNPFSRRTNRETVVAIQEATPAELNCRSKQGLQLAKIVNRCLAKNPADRYPSANEILRELEFQMPPRAIRSPQCH